MALSNFMASSVVILLPSTFLSYRIVSGTCNGGSSCIWRSSSHCSHVSFSLSPICFFFFLFLYSHEIYNDKQLQYKSKGSMEMHNNTEICFWYALASTQCSVASSLCPIQMFLGPILYSPSWSAIPSFIISSLWVLQLLCLTAPVAVPFFEISSTFSFPSIPVSLGIHCIVIFLISVSRQRGKQFPCH